MMGCDPGGHTGIAVGDLWYTSKPQDFGLFRTFRVDIGMMMTTGWDDRAKNLRMVIQQATEGLTKPFVVVTEKYIVTQLTVQSQDTQSLEVNGTLESILELLDVPHELFSVAPSSTKPLFPDSKLRALGYDLRRVDDHARDAMRNILWWAHQFIHSKVQLSSISSSE